MGLELNATDRKSGSVERRTFSEHIFEFGLLINSNIDVSVFALVLSLRWLTFFSCFFFFLSLFSVCAVIISVLCRLLVVAACQSGPTADWAGSLSPTARLSLSARWPLTSGIAAAPTLLVSLLMLSFSLRHTLAGWSLWRRRTLACVCVFHVDWSAEETLTNSPSSYRLCCLNHILVFSLTFTVWSQQRRLFRCQTILSRLFKLTHSLFLRLSVFFFASRSAPVLPGAYHQGVQMQPQQQYHGYMHQTSMSSVRSVTSPPHSASMVRPCSKRFSRSRLWLNWLNILFSDPITSFTLISCLLVHFADRCFHSPYQELYFAKIHWHCWNKISTLSSDASISHYSVTSESPLIM